MAPRFSVVTAVHDPVVEHLAVCLRSVQLQRPVGVEHVIVDDASTSAAVRSMLDDAARRAEVTVHRRAANGGIAVAGSDALSLARGEFVVFLDHDDELTDDALAAVAAVLDADPSVDVVYSDHDAIRPDGRYAAPSYKPDFSPERLRAQNYITHLLVARRSLVEAVGGLRAGFDGAQDHDLVLRLSERTDRIVHVPRILYHWRQAPTSVSADPANKRYAFEHGRRAVQEHCDRVGIPATVELGPFDGAYRVRRRVVGEPLVSVVVPTRGSSGLVWGTRRAFVVEAVRSILDHSTYRHLEFVVVADEATPRLVLDELGALGGDVRIVHYDRPFNFSDKVNVGVLAARGDHLLVLNDDTELVDPSSIEVLLAHVQTDGVGMAGAKLLFEDGTLQHGGHVYHHDPMHACFGWPGDHPGPMPLRPLGVERECSGVTAAAAMVRRDVFEEVGGFTTELPLSYNDVDFSLKVRQEGYRIVWTPYAVWHHFESRTRVSEITEREWQVVNQRWHYQLHHDPYYNPNLAPRRSDWVERPLRSGAAPIGPRSGALTRLAASARRARPRTAS